MTDREEPTWDERDDLATAIQKTHIVSLDELDEIVSAVVAAGWRPPVREESEHG